MNNLRAIGAITRADFFERTRSYRFLITLLFALYLGYATARGQITLQSTAARDRRRTLTH